MGQKRSSADAPKHRSKSGDSCKFGESKPNRTSNDTKQQPEIHESSSKHTIIPQHNNGVSQDVSELAQQNYDYMHANDLAFKDYQPIDTYQFSNELSNGPNISLEYIECSYHRSVLQGYNTLSVNGYGLDPMHRWMGEGISEQNSIGYSHDGSSSLRRGCTCDQKLSLPVGKNL